MAVRRESVELSLRDVDFTTGMAKAAAQTAMFNRQLDALDGTSIRTNRSTTALGSPSGGIAKTGEQSRRASADIDRLSGRVRLLAEAGLALGPALFPLGAGLAPALSGTAAGLGSIVAGAGVAALAANGLGDALEALNDYQLEPTAENLQAVNQELAGAGRAGAEFVTFLHSLEPELRSLQLVARNQMLPGMAEGIDHLLDRLPQVRSLIGSFASEMGDLSADAGEALAGEEWDAFFEHLERDGVPTLDAVSRGVGNLALGFANLMVGMAPLTRMFVGGFADSMEDFAEWSANLDDNQGFQDFLDYAAENAPEVIDLIGATASAVSGLAHAAAPVGAVALPILTGLLEIIGAIGQSPLGPALYTAAAGMIVMNRAGALLDGTLGRLGRNSATVATGLDAIGGKSSRTAGALNSLAGKVGVLAAALLAAQAVDAGLDKLFDTSIDQSTLARDLEAMARGDVVANLDSIGKKLRELSTNGFNSDSWLPEWVDEGLSLGGLIGDTRLDEVQEQLKGVDEQLASMVESGTPERAQEAFEQIADLAAEQGVSINDVTKAFPQYQTAVENAALASEHYASGAGAAAEANRRNLESLVAAQGVARDTAGEFITLGSSLNDSKTSLSGWIKQLEDQARALREFGQNAQTAARRGLREGLIKELQAAGPAGAMRLEQLASASDKEIKRANRAWRLGQQAIKDYITTTTGVPPIKSTELLIRGPAQAKREIATLKAQIDSLRDKTVTLTVVQRNGANKRAGLLEGTLNALGGLWMDGARFYAGGGLDRPNAHQPEIASGRSLRIWAEPETQGEAYIPLANDHRRPRAKTILETTAAMFGGDVEWYAGGGLRDRLRGAARPGAISIAASYGIDIDRDDKLKRRLNLFSRSLDQAKKALDDETSARDSLVGSITSSLTGDLWGDDVSPWSSDWAAGSIGAINAKLAQQIAEGNEFNSLQASLRARGLTGPAFQEVAANGGLAGLRTFATASNADLATFQSRYNERGRVVGAAASGVAGSLGMTAAVDATTAQVEVLNATVRRLEKQLKEKSKKDTRERRQAAQQSGAAAGNAVKKPLANGAKRNRKKGGRR